jgi:carbamoyltransferase
MKILGFTSMYHDSSACLLVDGHITGYAEEERFNRKKHTADHPWHAIEWILESQGLRLDDVDDVVYYLNPWSYLRTGIKAALANFPKSLALGRREAATLWPVERVLRLARLKSELRQLHKAHGDFNLVCLDHYRTHQASAFFASEFDDAAIVTMDFAVDGTTEVVAHGRGNQISDRVTHRVPNGFALVYATMTHMLGFKWYDEYKVMGMAAYGEPRYLDKIEQLYRLHPETGTLELDFKYFDFQNYGMSRLYSARMKELFWEPRKPDAPITQREYDLAASLQAATNRYGIAMASLAKRLTGSRSLCMAGGVAQNCLMNQAICESGIFDNVFLQPLAGDVGGSIGGALYQYHHVHGRPRLYAMHHLYLGPAYRAEAAAAAAAAGLRARPSQDWHDDVAKAIADGLVVGYFDGRMEAGPPALG